MERLPFPLPHRSPAPHRGITAYHRIKSTLESTLEPLYRLDAAADRLIVMQGKPIWRMALTGGLLGGFTAGGLLLSLEATALSAGAGMLIGALCLVILGISIKLMLRALCLCAVFSGIVLLYWIGFSVNQ